MTDAELLKRYEAALLAIIHMDVYTREGEAPAHEVMRHAYPVDTYSTFL